MSRMAEMYQEVRDRTANTYCMLRDSLGIVLDNQDEVDRDLIINKDQACELSDDLWYAVQQIRNDILPMLEISVDEHGRIVDETEQRISDDQEEEP